MSTAPTEEIEEREGPLDLVPRMKGQGYEAEAVELRRRWVEERTGARLRHVGSHTIPSEEMRGNVENPVGAAGADRRRRPARSKGLHAPAAYTSAGANEGALVAPTSADGAVTRAGGGDGAVTGRERVSPVFPWDDGRAHDFAQRWRRL